MKVVSQPEPSSQKKAARREKSSANRHCFIRANFPGGRDAVMKCIMYHYIRPCPEGLDFFRYLHIDHFRRQLDWFAGTSRFVGRDEFFEAAAHGSDCEGVVLTFDDGFSDHHQWVLPELQARGLWGFFFVPTATYRTGKLLDVHRIHVLLGRQGGVQMMKALNSYAREMFSHADVQEFRSTTYCQQDGDGATLLFKRALNYYISHPRRASTLDALMLDVFGDEPKVAHNFYVQPEQIREMHNAGMVIGGHSVTHPVFSRLGIRQQEAEIRDSLAFLQDVTGSPITTFCYPYGGFQTFTADTERLLAGNGCTLCFNVEPRDLTGADFSRRPLALPRYDCNLFPFGQASMGRKLAGESAGNDNEPENNPAQTAQY